jgi:hypothetical protein
VGVWCLTHIIHKVDLSVVVEQSLNQCPGKGGMKGRARDTGHPSQWRVVVIGAAVDIKVGPVHLPLRSLQLGEVAPSLQNAEECVALERFAAVGAAVPALPVIGQRLHLFGVHL